MAMRGSPFLRMGSNMPLIIETPRPADNWWYDPLIALMIFAMNVFAFFVLPVMADGLIWLFHEGLRY